MKEVRFGLTRIAWNGRSQFWSDWDSLEWTKLVLAGLEWLGLEKVSFNPTQMACMKNLVLV
jgi:hypothetical protein